jgi:hypothetical protein
LGSQVLTAGTVNLVPFSMAASRTLSDMYFRMPFGGSIASSSARIGIYDIDSDGSPTTARLDLGPVATTSDGLVTVACSHSLPAGKYWLALQASAGITVTAAAANGFVSEAGATISTSSIVPVAGLVSPGTYGSSLPSLTAATLNVRLAGNSLPMIGLR